ncbi:nucleotidyltransferase [Oceanobacillus halophilus]|uniref:tRNA(Met) cytidine acetate ligase n=1 Tax=Oceanobacillus halophilus TaxID=930130 RepID=A0A495AC15_9BACI|nr:nucleotidyltransferase [Oceanobacillus halophilus]RKQ37383.1 nucleotidyltransferase [Oceanobacillus halophilus]
MKACGLIVEYNPFHNGHAYHIQEAKKVSNADCMIAIMSGSFLQRGEPAIIDKFHRTKAAISAGIDIVLELPYVFAVQNSDIFAKGAVLSLNELGVSSICFGSESGNISYFIKSYENYKEKEPIFKNILKSRLAEGMSFPEASKLAYQEIGLTNKELDLAQPNNILGFSYVKAIMDNQLPIEPLTIERTKNNFHDQMITDKIASATSIRKNLIDMNQLTEEITKAIPNATINQLEHYKKLANIWHTWEHYFHLLHYRVMTMSKEELREIHGVTEGIENRIKNAAKQANSLYEWIELVKTKRYTWTRIQRIFVHILTNTTKKDIEPIIHSQKIPYTRILGLTNRGRKFLNTRKKDISTPIITSFNRETNQMLEMEERATHAYLSILNPDTRRKLFQQELRAPIISETEKD